ncbi:Fur family transcriptional regulator Irr [Bradyrhizobium betae]
MDLFPGDKYQEFLVDAEAEAGCGRLDADGPGCARLLRDAGLRPTRQRVMLGELLFARGDRHVTAEMLYGEAVEANIQLSLATVYNTLNQFTQAGLLRRIGPDGSRSFFDTNTSVHPHFYLVGEDVLIDVPERLIVAQMPEALPGHEISRLDIIIHICRKPSDI